MSPSASVGSESKRRCLVLLLEPTPYILPRALYLKRDPTLSVDLYFTFLNASQPWGLDADAEGVPVLLDRSVSFAARMRNIAALVRRIVRGEYGAAHLAGWAHWVVRLSILACRMRGVPFAVESDTPLRTSNGWRGRTKDRVYPLWMKWITFAIPGGTRQAEYFRHYGVPQEKILISHMTVDTARVRDARTPARREFREARGIPTDQVVCLFVGRLVHQKAIDVLLAAFEIAAARDPKLGLAIVGDGPERERVEKFVGKFPGRVWYPGRENQRGVISWMRSSDAFILPSRREPWGLVVNEAMVCGLPIIVSDACGCVDDLIFHQENGYVFPVDNVVKLAEAITAMATDKEKRTAMGEASQRIIAPWVIERQAETIKTALVKMLDSR
ncbi:MAG: glycosyltransferase family 4 protein [Terriglobia bacterium]|jgi:glycosyltransferase involved in cell wall biosynthesis|nr:glycosyltransferase family 4 protein [Terriglobia bacterium]